MGLLLVEPQRHRRRLLPGHVPRDERNGLLGKAKFPGGRLRGLWQPVQRAALLGFQPCLLHRSAAQKVLAHLALAERIDIQRFDQQPLAGQRNAVVRRAVLYGAARLVLAVRRGC